MNNDIQNRMKSIRQTVQISSAQKLIAASNIGRARVMLENARPYHERVRAVIAEVLACCPEGTSRYFVHDMPQNPRRGVLVLAANKGLAGGYNSNIMQYVENSLRESPAEHLIVLGSAGRKRMLAAGHTFDTQHDLTQDPPSMYTARELAEQITTLFEQGKIDCYDVIYTQFFSTVRLKPTEARLFPLSPTLFVPEGKPRYEPGSVIFEPEPEAVLSSLMLKYLKGFLYGCLIHTWISELASRVMAMDNAVRNGNEMLDALSLAFNRSRQASITQEITEIVAGATAMSARE